MFRAVVREFVKQKVKLLFVQFPVESVREVARVLVESNLGEVTLETIASAGVPTARLSVKRSAGLPVVSASAFVGGEGEDISTTPSAPEVAQPAIVSAPCVGIFRAAKTPVEVGARVKKRQLVGVVESLRIPNEIYAPDNGVVAQVLVSDGQGVEWGQVLMEIVLEAGS